MPAVDVQDCSFVKKGKVRLIIMGKPNSRKTSSFPSFPSPKVISGCPGEKHTAILSNTEGVRVRLWEDTPGAGPRVTWNEYLAETKNILESKVLAGSQCAIFDGLHRLQRLAIAAGRAEVGKKSFDAWEKGKENFKQWVDMGYKSDIPVVIWVCWAKADVIDELASAEDQAKAKKGYYLDLIGAEQREMMGDYSIVYQYVEGGKAYWQLVGDERAECGLRVPPEQAASLPYKVEASWPKLAEVLSKFSVVGASMALTSTEQGAK